ncbi:MAG: hypothetical protein ACLFUP_03850 [Desulfobacteraceae bacterium]
MSTVGWINSIKSSSMVDKVQHAQQTQEEVGREQSREKALQQEKLRRSKVFASEEDEKVRLQKERDDRRRERRRKKGGEQGAGEEAGEGPTGQNIDLEV